LIQSASFEHLHADATYKLTWEGFPVLVVGVTDANRSFHPVCVSISSNETTASFQFIFNALKQKDFHPKFLISDAACAIRQAFKTTFNSEKTVMCWAHVHRNISKHLHLASSLSRDQIMKDI